MSRSDAILVVGATGIAGSYIYDHLSANAGCPVVGLSRSGNSDLKADLTDERQLDGLHESLANVQTVVYAAFAGDGAAAWADLTDKNTRMFETVINVVERHARSLKRIVLIQGQKYYGTHLGPFKTPAQESDPRHAGQNFYFTQQDLLAERSAAAAWDYVCLRPHIICGLNLKAPQNPIAVLSRYAMLMKAQGQPLHWPGHPDAWDKLCQATDATLLGECVGWAIDAPDAGGEGFNIINGDYFRWSQMWQVIADTFDMPVGEIRQIDLTEKMPPLAAEYLPGVPDPDWAFANYMLTRTYDVMAGMTKIRQFGFQGFRDSVASFHHLLTLAGQKVDQDRQP